MDQNYKFIIYGMVIALFFLFSFIVFHITIFQVNCCIKCFKVILLYTTRCYFNVIITLYTTIWSL